ncbi:hypothetical protein IQ264_23150 [Phormidium sp. LEGE 05292]|uniref:hypothetical protein n=1 Tax=[Phormidium] sp. LEGE 05292 TaxID=767427 RepID=UPI001881A280|nr:hypothetical protein [Phormidium sp. LEGE 05292]MBE9228325.1 hypothetical protein [Phormidium sp. LEGE 05292]
MQNDSSSLSLDSQNRERHKRNRKRSKRRSIHCPIHACYLDSVSQKHRLFASQIGELRHRGISRKNALQLIAERTAVQLDNEWLEAFWCKHCQETKWYYIRKLDTSYEILIAPAELWQTVTGVIDPDGNPSVSEFTKRQSRMRYPDKISSVN